jgi:hypothetical protein
MAVRIWHMNSLLETQFSHIMIHEGMEINGS